MNNEKLEDLKVMSTVSFVICLIMTIMFLAGDLDSIKNGEASLWFLTLIGGIATGVSLIIAIVTSSTLKKRQGEAYFSTKMYIEGFFELFFPSLLESYSAELRKLNVSEKNKKTRLWQELCVGYDKTSIISFVLWFLLLVACVWMIVDNILHNGDNKWLDVTAASIVVIILIIILVCVASGIKKDPTPIFEYMDITKVKFNTLAKHYANSERITHRIWTDKEFVFVQSKGKAYCFPVEDYEDMTINLSRFRFTMVLTSKYNCIIQSSFFPFGFLKLKKLLKNNNKEN